MQRTVLLAFLVAVPLILGAGDATAKTSVPPGGIRLIDGYQHEDLVSTDSHRGRIWKDGALEMFYDIGEFAGNRAASVKVEDRIWARRQVVQDRPVEIVRSKDGYVTLTFGSGEPANFYAKISSEEQLTDFLLIALTYPIAQEAKGVK